MTLVIVASRHGGTREIGEVIAATLVDRGVPCEVRSPEEIRGAGDLEGHDAVIIGSPIYTGRWLPEARELIDKIGPALGAQDVWLFSSGLADAPSKASNRPAETLERMRETGAVGHKHFPGRLDLSVLNFAERAIIVAARGKQGDRRDMAAVQMWAEEIAEKLQSRARA